MAKVTWEMSGEEAVGSSRTAFIKKIYELAQKDEDIVLVNCDCSPEGSMQDKFGKSFGDRFLDCGIAEQNACGIASGLALSGKKVFCQAFGPFLSMRSVEFVYLDGAYNRAPVTYIGTHCGVTAEAGPTHAAIMDIAYMRAMPEMTIVAPTDAVVIEKLMEKAVSYGKPMYVRCARGEEPLVYKPEELEDFEIGKGILYKNGTDITLIGCGNGVYQCVKAAEKLAAEGIDARVIDLHTIKPIDKEIILKAARETKGIITVEDHVISGGLGSAVCEVLEGSDDPEIRVQVKRLGIPDCFFIQGAPEEVYAYYGYDAQGIYRSAKEMLGK
jgi:transketolase